jgi:hypothetical protein
MVNLTNLNLQANRLEGTLPANLMLIPSLTKLGFHGNKITDIPSDIGKYDVVFFCVVCLLSYCWLVYIYLSILSFLFQF